MNFLNPCRKCLVSPMCDEECTEFSEWETANLVLIGAGKILGCLFGAVVMSLFILYAKGMYIFIQETLK